MRPDGKAKSKKNKAPKGKEPGYPPMTFAGLSDDDIIDPLSHTVSQTMKRSKKSKERSSTIYIAKALPPIGHPKSKLLPMTMRLIQAPVKRMDLGGAAPPPALHSTFSGPIGNHSLHMGTMTSNDSFPVPRGSATLPALPRRSKQVKDDDYDFI